jgi:glycosyltransferase involved in cell wall biosynthesis
VRVVFNLRLLRAGQIGGMENVVRRMAAGLAAQPLSAEQQLIALCPPGERETVEAMCAWTDIVTVAPDESERRMARAVRRLRPDLLLCPLLNLEPLDAPCPGVAYIPDLQHETFPEFFSPEVLEWRRRVYAETARQADLIFTCSHYSRGTILARYPDTPPERVVVLYPGVDPEFEAAPAAPSDAAARHGLPSDYLLYPANFWPHKNHRRILEALALLGDDAPHLALTGSPSSGQSEIETEIARLGLEARVTPLGRVSREGLVDLMRLARALVFPSLYEGFGLPILEAFHSGTPVLCSNIASCPEVAGDAALLVDPRSADGLAEALRRIWTDADLRAELVEKGGVRRQAFAWERGAQTLRTALLAVAARRKPRPSAFRRLLRALRPASLSP